MKNLFNKLIDFYVIIIQVSIKITIIPYFLYSEFPYNWSLIHLLNGVIISLLLIVRFNFKIYPFKKIFKSGPIICFFLLLFFQFLSGIAKGDFNYIIFPVIISFNFIVFIIYLNNLFLDNVRRITSPNGIISNYFNFSSSYMLFTGFQVVLVVISAILVIGNIIPLFDNNINHLYEELIGDNVRTGTQYFMSGFSSIQTPNIRLDSVGFATFTGWSHEPHVFTYLTIPALFFYLSKYQFQRNIIIIVCLLFLLASLLSFSVTSLLALIVVFVIKLAVKPKSIFFAISLILVTGIVLSQFQFELLADIFNYTFNKLFDDTSSAEYSSSRIIQILIPRTVFGDGVLLLSMDSVKSAGLFTSIIYFTFYFLIFKQSFNVIKSKNEAHSFVGMGIMYFFLHGLKLTSAVFAMPYTIYMLTIFSIFNIYVYNHKKI